MPQQVSMLRWMLQKLVLQVLGQWQSTKPPLALA